MGQYPLSWNNLNKPNFCDLLDPFSTEIKD